jgi:hypothetical protein
VAQVASLAESGEPELGGSGRNDSGSTTERWGPDFGAAWSRSSLGKGCQWQLRPARGEWHRQGRRVLVVFRAMNEFLYHILPIIHAYNVGILRLRSKDVTPVVCPTLLERYDSCRITWLQTQFLIPVDVMTPSTSWLLTPIAHHGFGRWACRMSYHLSWERLRMARLHDCSILQLGHLVRSRLGATHDSISIQNSVSHGFTCSSSQVMCRATNNT